MQRMSIIYTVDGEGEGRGGGRWGGKKFVKQLLNFSAECKWLKQELKSWVIFPRKTQNLQYTTDTTEFEAKLWVSECKLPFFDKILQKSDFFFNSDEGSAL